MDPRRRRLVILCGLALAVAAGVAWQHFSGGLAAGPDGGREAMFWEPLPEGQVRCVLCFRRCVIAPGQRGFCRVRVNRNGRLYTLSYGFPVALQIDPIEKEPLYHFLPGSRILGVGFASCNFRCQFCQNWHLSQRAPEDLPRHFMTPLELLGAAQHRGIDIISFTYNEPTVAYEYLLDVAQQAAAWGVKMMFHTNGSMNEEPLDRLLDFTAAVTVDLKAFTADFYQGVTFSELGPVLRTLRHIHGRGIWLEIVNLVIPTLNDNPEHIREMSEWIVAELSPDVPVHFNRFRPAYRMTELPSTPIETLEMARRIATEAGLRYVYIGNVPGHENNSTFCPRCGDRIIHRVHFTPIEVAVGELGRCPGCQLEIPGVWTRRR